MQKQLRFIFIHLYLNVFGQAFNDFVGTMTQFCSLFSGIVGAGLAGIFLAAGVTFASLALNKSTGAYFINVLSKITFSECLLCMYDIKLLSEMPFYVHVLGFVFATID